MKSWPLGAKIGAGVLVAVVVLFMYGRLATRQPPESSPVEEATQRPAKSGDRVQQRLDQLRASHRNKRKDESEARIEARSGAPAGTGPRMARPEGAGQAAPGGKPEVPREVGDAPPFDEDPDDIPALTNLALHDPDPERRLAAVTMLGSADDPEVIPALAQALADQDDEVRMAALEALSDFTDEPPVDLIARAADDPSPDIRFEAIDVLSDIGGDRARGAIEKALSDPDEDVRSLAEGIMDFEQLYEPTPGEAAPAGSAGDHAPAPDGTKQ